MHLQTDMLMSGQINKQKAQKNTIAEVQLGHVHSIQRQVY